jgi:hypothetical protein
VGKEQYNCSTFQAAFLSKAVSELFLADPIASELVIDDILDPEEHFRTLVHCMHHGTLEITESNVQTLQKFTDRLRCEELGRRLFEFELAGETMNERNVVQR